MSKSTLDSLKSVVSVFRRKPLLGAPDFISSTSNFSRDGSKLHKGDPNFVALHNNPFYDYSEHEYMRRSTSVVCG